MGWPSVYFSRSFLDGAPSAMVLGDNIFFGNGLPEAFAAAGAQAEGATVFGYHVDPERYGVVGFDIDGAVQSITEKPKVRVLTMRSPDCTLLMAQPLNVRNR